MIISIIIPTKDRVQILRKSLWHLNKAVEEIVEVDEILIVNDSEALLQSDVISGEKVKILQNPGSGAGSARNFGAYHAKGDYLLFLDDDMIVSEQNIKDVLLNNFDKEEMVLNINWVYPPDTLQQLGRIKFGRYLIKYGFTSMKGWNNGQFWDDTCIFKKQGVASHFLLMKKETFVKVGGYDESIPFAGFEDFVFSEKLHKNNIAVCIDPLNIAIHNEEDRLNLYDWLERKRRGGITRKAAVSLGYNELRIVYPKWKQIVYLLLISHKGTWVKILESFPSSPIFFPIYCKLVNLLLGMSIFEGYTIKNIN